MGQSTFLIKSTENKSFGTGFCVDRDSNGSFLLTCQHVVESCGEDFLEVNGQKAEMQNNASTNELIDLAVIYVEALEATPLRLSLASSFEGLSFEIDGFKTHKDGTRKLETLDGSVKKVSYIYGDSNNLETYELSIGEGDSIEKGYSGSAIVAKGSGQVIAVATDRTTSGKQAYAIPLKYLKEAWHELNPKLFDTITPFVGLSAFGRDDRDYFFGRDDEVEEIFTALKTNDIMAVIGDSGSGKSSFVKAGVIPKYIDKKENDNLHIIEIRPARNPFVELARFIAQFCDVLDYSQADIGYFIDKIKIEEFQAIQSVFEQLYKEDNSELLLYVDQFEELFTMCTDEVQKKFIELLLFLLEHQNDYLSIKILLTMRRDYYNLLREYDLFSSLIETRTYLLKRMKDDKIKEVIEKPLKILSVKPSEVKQLSNIILSDLGDEATEITLLQIALTETWLHKAEYNHDLLESYVSIGKVTGALSTLATNTMESLNTQEKEIFKYIFIRIVKLSDMGGVTRRLAERSEFSDEAWKLVQRLASVYDNKEEKNKSLGRLLKLKNENEQDTKVVTELVHEALVTQWSTYVTWLRNINKENKKRIHDALIDKSKVYKKDPQAKFLLTGHSLEVGFKLLDDDYREFLSFDEKTFIELSKKRENYVLFWKFMGVFTLILLLVVSGYLWQDSKSTQLRTQSMLYDSVIKEGIIARDYLDAPLKAKLIFANAMELSVNSIQKKNTNILYSFNYFKLSDFLDIENEDESCFQKERLSSVEKNQLLQLLIESYLELDPMWEELILDNQVDWSKDRKYIISWGFSFEGESDCAVVLWDIEDMGEPIQVFHHSTYINGAYFTKSGKQILSYSDDSTVNLWSVQSSTPLQTIQLRRPTADVCFNSTEDKIFIDKMLWSLNKSVLLKTFKDNSIMSFKHDEKEVLSWEDESISNQVRRQVDKQFEYGLWRGARLSKDNKQLLFWSMSGSLILWDVEKNKFLQSFDQEPSLAPIGSGVTLAREYTIGGARFNKKEKNVLSWGFDDAITLWEIGNNIPLRVFYHTEVSNAIFNKNEKQILSWSRDIIRLWDIEKGILLHSFIEGNNIENATFSEDEKQIFYKKENAEIEVYTLFEENRVPNKFYSLKAQVETGAYLNKLGEVKALNEEEWEKKKKEYEEILAKTKD